MPRKKKRKGKPHLRDDEIGEVDRRGVRATGRLVRLVRGCKVANDLNDLGKSGKAKGQMGRCAGDAAWAAD
jgi:hypothetical protein